MVSEALVVVFGISTKNCVEKCRRELLGCSVLVSEALVVVFGISTKNCGKKCQRELLGRLRVEITGGQIFRVLGLGGLARKKFAVRNLVLGDPSPACTPCPKFGQNLPHHGWAASHYCPSLMFLISNVNEFYHLDQKAILPP